MVEKRIKKVKKLQKSTEMRLYWRIKFKFLMLKSFSISTIRPKYKKNTRGIKLLGYSSFTDVTEV